MHCQSVTLSVEIFSPQFPKSRGLSPTFSSYLSLQHLSKIVGPKFMAMKNPIQNICTKLCCINLYEVHQITQLPYEVPPTTGVAVPLALLCPRSKYPMNWWSVLNWLNNTHVKENGRCELQDNLFTKKEEDYCYYVLIFKRRKIILLS